MVRLLKRIGLFAVVFSATFLSIPAPSLQNKNDYVLAHIDNFQRVQDLEGGIIFLGTSQLAFGLAPELIESRCGIIVRNTGVHAGLGPELVLSELNSLNSNNLFVFSPTIEWLDPDYSYRDELKLLALNHLTAESILNDNLGLLWLVEERVSRIEYWFSRDKSGELDNWWDRRSFNLTGVIDSIWIQPNKGTNPAPGLHQEQIPAQCDCSRLKEAVKYDRRVLLLPPPVHKDDNAAMLDSLWEMCSQQSGIELLMNASDVSFESELFFDSYHLNSSGRKIYTSRILEKLISSGRACTK